MGNGDKAPRVLVLGAVCKYGQFYSLGALPLSRKVLCCPLHVYPVGPRVRSGHSAREEKNLSVLK
jgi:hypothetical protein